MAKFIDLTNEVFTRLTVISRAPNKGKQTAWYCKCICGNMIATATGALRGGRTKSCGCLRRESITRIKIRHGMAHTKVYRVWVSIVSRCTCKTNKAFVNYGGRGVSVCPRWLEFENFYADMGEPPQGYSVERIDNEKGYSADNCKWATCKTQANNKRNNHNITFGGKTLTLAQWAEFFGFKHATLSQRLTEYNWPVEKALLTPVRCHTRPQASE